MEDNLRLLTVYIDVEGDDVDQAVDKFMAFMKEVDHTTGLMAKHGVRSWEVDLEYAAEDDRQKQEEDDNDSIDQFQE